MPAVTFSYVVYPGFGVPHARQPQRAAGLSGGFDVTTLAAHGNSPVYPAGASVSVSSAEMPSTLSDSGGKSYAFAFANVSGAGGAPQTVFTNTATFSFLVGAATRVLFVYVPAGVGGTGVSVDAFDETRGSLVDDTFLSVNLITAGIFPDAALTTGGNADGWVPSPQNATIFGLSAMPYIAETNADFEAWHFVVFQTPPAGPGTGFLIPPAERTSLFAFYRDLPVRHSTGDFGAGSLQKTVVLLEPGGGRETFPGDAPGPPLVFSNENTPPEPPR